jgi:hypothetical protein
MLGIGRKTSTLSLVWGGHFWLYNLYHEESRIYHWFINLYVMQLSNYVQLLTNYEAYERRDDI